MNNSETVAGKAATAGNKPKVEIINASGHSAYGDKVASAMKSQGVIVGGIDNGHIRKTTTVIIPYPDKAVIDKLSGLPFKYDLQVNNGGDKGAPVIVVIGQDYAAT